ncbi:MAG: PorV/PorQ family protein [Syntrophothermus sp.]
MKLIKLFFISLLLCSLALPQTNKTGTTAGQVLKLNVGPRAIAMGGAFTSVANDISAMYWNPAGLTSITGSEAAFFHANMYADIMHDYAAFATNISDFGNLGVFVDVLSMDEMMVRTIENPQGTGEFFDAGAMVIGLSYARNLTTQFSIGANFKFISENIYNMNATGFGVDIGTLYRIPILNELRIAASISNFGTKMRLEGRDILVITPSGAGGANLINSNLELDKYDLPLIFRFGVSTDVIKSESNRITAAVDAIHPNDHTEYLNTGLEYSWNEVFYARAGYNSLFEKDSEKGFTLGAGINYKIADVIGVKFDYAYQDFGRLSNIQYLSIGLVF